ncbi:MAG: iron-containing alcohol dehydrogenase [Promethearchaeota archaeon]|nr:MAG: iron-containing alcohol dehydrogenase [Candidatus Lokiarchaeota archaeon]
MWYFYAPKTVFGEDALDYLDSMDEKRCFIVTDEGIIKFGMLEILTKKITPLEMDYKVFSGVEPDPREETILEATKICQDYKPDLIIALGGGSSMDVAKAVWVLYERPDLGIDDLYPFIDLKLGKKAKLVAIPTTSGTGAETTWASIITRKTDKGDIKLEQVHKEMIPTVAILDPVFVKSMPKGLTASTGFDALAHLSECIISVWKNDYSEAMALKAFELVQKYLPIAYEDGTNIEAREKMHAAANMAGLAFGNAQVHLGHALGHVLGATFHKPHGFTVGVFLPYVLQYCLHGDEAEETVNILGTFAKRTGVAKWDDANLDAAHKYVAEIKRLQKVVNHPTLSEMITREELDEKIDMMAEWCLESPSAAMSPRSAGSQEFKKIYEYAFENKDIDF